MGKLKKTRKVNRQKGGWNQTNNAIRIHKQLFKTPEALLDRLSEQLFEYILRVAPERVPREILEASFSVQSNFVRSFDYRKLAAKDPLGFIDNEDYSKLKISSIPVGTLFYRRHHTKEFVKRDHIWLDYSARIDPDQPITRHSFLLRSFYEPFDNPLNENYLSNDRYGLEIVDQFGPHLFILELEEPKIVLHFPVNYDNPSSPENFWSYDESEIRSLFLNKYFSYLDGYTLDFIFYNPNNIYKNLPVLRNYRELYLNNSYGLKVLGIM